MWNVGNPAGVRTRKRPVVKRLKSYDGPVGIGIIENGDGITARATLSMGDTTLTMRPLEGELPKHKSLFPTECDTSVQVDRVALVRAGKKCQALIRAKGENNSPVSFAWDDEDTLRYGLPLGSRGIENSMILEARACHRAGTSRLANRRESDVTRLRRSLAS